MDTIVLRQAVQKTSDLKGFEELPEMFTDDELWVSHLKDHITQCHLSNQEFCNLLEKEIEVAKNTAKSWFLKRPPKKSGRDYILKICLILGLNLEETNCLLDRYGRFRPLYVMNVRDAIYYFHINQNRNHMVQTNVYRNVVFLCQKYKDYPFSLNASLSQAEIHLPIDSTTQARQKKIDKIKSAKDLHTYILETQTFQEKQNQRLMDWIDEWAEQWNISIHQISVEGQAGRINTMLSNIRNKKVYPTRDDIILLGLVACMDAATIDSLLMAAGMEVLFPKNIGEAFIQFALNDSRLHEMNAFRTKDMDFTEIERKGGQPLNEDGDSMLEYMWKQSRICRPEIQKKLDKTDIFKKIKSIVSA